MREQKEVICKDGIYYCPICGSKKITINISAALNKLRRCKHREMH